MLNERFLARLHDAFPVFYDRIDAQAREEAARLRIQTNGDLPKALTRARLAGAGRIWWPYVKGSVPVIKRDHDAMEAFSYLILTVDHLVGYDPGTMDAARQHVLTVLRDSLDVERLKDIVKRKENEEAKVAAGAAGLMATMTALLSPFTLLKNLRTWTRWLPGWGKIAATAVIISALASVPLVAGMSAGHKAEQAARGASDKIK